MNQREQVIRYNFKYFGGVSFCYGLLFAFCMYRNLFGATFLVYAIATVCVLTMFLGKLEISLKKSVKIYFLFVILCGISTCFTSSKILQWLNWCCIIGLLVFAMLGQFFDESKWNIGTYMINAAVLFFSTLTYSFLPMAETARFTQEKKAAEGKDRRQIRFIVFGILGAVGMLVIILPLLISSDLVFGQMFFRFSQLFRMEEVLPNFITAVGITVTVFLGFVLIYTFFYASCHVDFSKERERIFPRCHCAAGLSFTAVIGFIYVMYSGIQIIYLFFGSDGKLPSGITYSQYARSGFWQLVAVALLNILMVLACMYIFEENKYLKWFLTVICACTFVMTASAGYRMYLYVQAYHLTFLRLLVFWSLLIIMCIMGGVITSIYKRKFPFVQYTVLVTVCGYLIFSFARPDYLIARYNVSHMQEISENDLNYMLYGLSLDAAPVVAQIDPGDTYARQSVGMQEYVKDQLDQYFLMVSENNKEIYFRKANYSRIQAKKAADQYLKESGVGKR